MRDKSALRAKVERITNLATMPRVAVKLRNMMDAPTVSARGVGEEIGKDQVLATKVLKLVNSGFYGFRTPITTITQAMVLLGFDVVKTLVLSTSIIDIFSLMNESLGGLWEHSFGTATAANAFAERLKFQRPEELGVAGLLHDIGKVIIAQSFPDEYAQIRTIISERRCMQIEAEREVLGVTHPEVAAWMLKKWSLPPKLLYPIAYHNNFHPSREFADRTAVVHIADIVCRAKGVGYAGDDVLPAIDHQAWDLLHLSMSDVAHVCRQVDVRVGERMFS